MHQTPRVLNTLSAAEKQAREWGHDYVGTEHLLVALLNDSDGIAGRVLSEVGVSDTVRSRIEDIVKSDGYNKEAPFPTE